MKNTQTLPALSKLNKTMKSAAKFDEPTYHTWFYDLHGGRTEYVITIACMIGKFRTLDKIAHHIFGSFCDTVVLILTEIAKDFELLL